MDQNSIHDRALREIARHVRSKTFLRWRPARLDWLLGWIGQTKPIKVHVRKSGQTISYIDVPAAFDIETTSLLLQDREKAATMYIWQLGICGRCCYGRTWGEFTSCLQQIAHALQLGPSKRLVVYIHNLAFEFQFMRQHMEWVEVFATDERKPIKACCSLGVEFRDSLILTNTSLEKAAHDLQHVQVLKASGDLDYSMARGSGTPLTHQELFYCWADIMVVQSLILDKIIQDGNITRIPATKTGYVRRHVRNECLYTTRSHKTTDRKKYTRYRDIMGALQLESAEYKQCKRAFQGGFTHACAFYSGKVLQDVASFDIASSYPTVMCAEQFPGSRGWIEDPSNFDEAVKKYCCLIDIVFDGLRAVRFEDHPLSRSKCYVSGCWQEDNGRLVHADHVATTITNIDWFTLRDFYEWDRCEVRTLRCYVPAYLPRDLILSVLGLYHDKTALKNIPGREADYMLAKENINSCYGMMVTDIVRPGNRYINGEWARIEPNLESSIEQYNHSKSRFLFYPWGVFVTAYARRNLFAAIKECGRDYVYSDTDSVKILHAEAHRAWFKRYNRRIDRKLRMMCRRMDIPHALTAPQDSRGIPHPLGVFEYEGTYDYFKTLGAKRYLTSKNGDLTLTMAGVSKKAAGFLKDAGRGDFGAIFGMFADGLYIPASDTGKLTHTYIDYPVRGAFHDYTGALQEFSELSAVHLMGADYSLSISRQYIDYLLQIVTEGIIT